MSKLNSPFLKRQVPENVDDEKKKHDDQIIHEERLVFLSSLLLHLSTSNKLSKHREETK